MPESLLTDAKVNAAKPTDRDWKLSDGGGLFLADQARPRQTLAVEVPPARQGEPLCHWHFPQVGLAEARAAREKARALVKQGIHPAHERQQVKQRNLEVLEDLQCPSRPILCSVMG